MAGILRKRAVTNNIVATEMTNALTVGNVIVQLPSQAVKIISTESNGNKVTTGLNVAGASTTVRRVGWREVPQ